VVGGERDLLRGQLVRDQLAVRLVGVVEDLLADLADLADLAVGVLEGGSTAVSPSSSHSPITRSDRPSA
jgi:hypothetical protein